MKHSNSPIFIGGLFKSGTSLLRAILGQHSRIAAGLESYWFDLDWDGQRDARFHEHIERLRKFYDMENGTLQNIIRESASSLDFLNRFLSNFALSQDKERWAEKTPGNILHLKEIFAEFPDAKVIHIIRDPKDIFASLRQAKKWDTVPVFVDMWCRFLGAADLFEKGSSDMQDSLLTVRYEQLVMNTADTMKIVMDFLDEEWEESLSYFPGQKEEYQKVLEITGKASTTLDRLRKPISNDRVNIWKGLIPESEIEEIRAGVSREGLLELFKGIEEMTPQTAV